MKAIKTLRGVFFLAAAATMGVLPASAMDRVTHYAQQNPSSTQFNLQQRYERLAFGQWITNALGNNTNGFYSNIAVTPSGGLFVQVAPGSTNTLGSVYQFQPDDTTLFGSGSQALPADPTQIFVQGTLSSPPVALGPLTPPVAGGQAIDYLVECQVQTVDRTPVAYNFVNSNNQQSQATVNRDRADTVHCQTKSGAPSGAPVVPTADAGWVGIAAVKVNSGASTVAQGDITSLPAFIGFSTPGSPIQIASLPHGDYMDLNTAQTATGGMKTFNGGLSVNSNIGGNGYAYNTGGSSYGAAGAYIAGTITSIGAAAFNTSVAIAPGTNGALGFNVAFSSTNPVITNSTEGGMNLSVGTNSGLGYRFFKYDGTRLTQLAQITPSGILAAYAGAFGGASYGASAGQAVIGNDGSNSYVRSGTGQLFFQNGDGSTTFASIGAAGLNVPGIYNSIGTSAGNGVLQVPGTGTLFLNLSSGGEVQIGNGAGGGSGIHLKNNGSITAGNGNFAAMSLSGGLFLNSNGIVGVSAMTGTVGGSAIQIQGNGLNGNGQLQLYDTTNTTNAPIKALRANGSNGCFEITNSALTAVIFSVCDTGNVSFAGSLNGGSDVQSVTSSDGTVNVNRTGSTVDISSPRDVPATHQFGGGGLVTGSNGEVCRTVNYPIIGATANYGANTPNYAIYIIEVDQQASNFPGGTVCFRALTTAGATQSGVGLYYNITTSNTHL